MVDIELIARRTASQIALAFRSGEAGPVALAEHLLGRIAASTDNAFIAVTADRAMAEARASAERYAGCRPLSPLDGVPIAWKDLFDIAGTRTTAASDIHRQAPVSVTDATCAANATAAGMVCLGKLNMTEFAFSGLGLNPHYGTPVNPNDRRTHRVPGGSSSGSGVAVAAGLVPCAIGSDTGGSVRVPAALNGTYGLKTSEGRIDKSGVVPLSRTLDTVGPLARSVEDCILLDMVLRGAVTAAARRRTLRDVSIVVPVNRVFERCEADVVANFDRCIEALVEAGASVERRAVAALDTAVETTAQHGSLVGAEAYHEYRALLDSPDGARIDGRVVHRMRVGAGMSASDLLSIQAARRQARFAVAEDLGPALLAMPTTAVTAPEVAPLDADAELFHKVNLLVLRNTMMGNFLGLCDLAVPSGRDRAGLPTGILFSAPHGRDDDLLGQGLEIGRALGGLFEPTWARD